eukprot:CAMPEP_0119323924 /NCGR_PEP_ID=MMETSP1333-20130426/61954_1 /TAXON_ID=418940 /ORGANISM="Scyphosphaera apsteinii, Strain RCC1455" /LENGTH=288 /DNA_ID=CAMNT_0007331495 /DNA_START=189 /DNA_END=1055 /DNA_ORIENTATION=+
MFALQQHAQTRTLQEGLLPPAKLNFILSQRNQSVPTTCRMPSVGFVGIGKAGSLFMQSALELFAHEELLPTTQFNVTSRSVGAIMGWHHASASLWMQAFGYATWTRAFTFALVRDPWSRLVSMWAFHLVSKHPLDGGYLTQTQRTAAKRNETLSIYLFRKWIVRTHSVYPPGSREEWRLFGAGHGNEQARSFNASQISWLVNEQGQLIVDAVFKLEQLQTSWPQLQARICGLQHVTYRSALENPIIRALDHPSTHRPYAEYYDGQTRSLVSDYTAPDIHRFSYTQPDI